MNLCHTWSRLRRPEGLRVCTTPWRAEQRKPTTRSWTCEDYGHDEEVLQDEAVPHKTTLREEHCVGLAHIKEREPLVARKNDVTVDVQESLANRNNVPSLPDF